MTYPQRAPILEDPERVWHGTTARERFWNRVEKTPTCWLWRGALNPVSGYGVLGARYVHRISYELHKGPIPVGLEIDHLCRVRRCLNPDHLEAVTTRENGLRGEGPWARAVRTGKCHQGHALTYARPDGTRQCQRCDRERAWRNVSLLTSTCPSCGATKTQRGHPERSLLCKSCGCKAREARKRDYLRPKVGQLALL